MTKYVISNRRAGKFLEDEKSRSRASLDLAFSQILAPNVTITGEISPSDEKERRILVVEADEKEMEIQKTRMPPDVLVEREILHYPVLNRVSHFSASPFAALANTQPPGSGATLTLNVVAQGGRPLEHAEVVLYLRGAGGQARMLSAKTPPNGQVIFSFSPALAPTVLVIEPAGGFWSMVVRGPAPTLTVTVPALPQGPLGWWHQEMNIRTPDLLRGTGIRVGVVDSGVGPHTFLGHVHDIGAYIDSKFDALGGAGAGAHGTHVCGIIGARPNNPHDFIGVAPGVELFSARVFPLNRGANQGDIAAAIEKLSKDHAVDLINLSLGAADPSGIEQDAIKDALERGTLCICAAGNTMGNVSYPAAFPETIAVSALGQEGWGPDGTTASTHYPSNVDRYGDNRLYLANFSCFGPQVACCAPGTGIISTVPASHTNEAYIAMDGTSMASPAACGALATLLAASPIYQALPRDEHRAAEARRLFKINCQDRGFDPKYQGQGIPQV